MPRAAARFNLVPEHNSFIFIINQNKFRNHSLKFFQTLSYGRKVIS